MSHEDDELTAGKEAGYAEWDAVQTCLLCLLWVAAQGAYGQMVVGTR